MVVGAGRRLPHLPGGGSAVLQPEAPARVAGLGHDAIGDVGIAVIAEHREDVPRAHAPGIEMIILLPDVGDQILHHRLHIFIRDEAEAQRNQIVGLTIAGAGADLGPVVGLINALLRLVELLVKGGINLLHGVAVFGRVVCLVQAVGQPGHIVKHAVQQGGCGDSRSLGNILVIRYIRVASADRRHPVAEAAVAPDPAVFLQLFNLHQGIAAQNVILSGGVFRCAEILLQPLYAIDKEGVPDRRVVNPPVGRRRSNRYASVLLKAVLHHGQPAGQTRRHVIAVHQ